jgi:8-oxo-dGTP diphosphatase
MKITASKAKGKSDAATKRSAIQLTVDVVVLTVHEQALKVLLIKRGIEPYRGMLAVPGGFVLEGETLEEAALRELEEETGTGQVYLEQLYTFGDPGRDPRGRVVSVAYFALIPADRTPLIAGTDAAEAVWRTVGELPKLAFDHKQIVAAAVERLRNKLEYTSVGFELLPRKFTLTALQQLHESILGRTLDKRNFRRKIQTLGLLQALKEKEATGRRPAQLFAFRQGK